MRSTLRRLVAIVGFLALVVAVPAVDPAAVGAEPRAASDAEAELVRLLNDERVSRGLEPLVRATQIDDFARRHSSEMVGADRLSHSDTAEIPNWRRVGENVGRGPSVESLHQAFLDSDPHRHNMLGSYTEVGVGVVVDGDTVWATVVFRVPADDGQPSEPATAAGAATPAGDGYWILEDDGSVHAFGAAGQHGSLGPPRDGGDAPAGARARDLEPTPSGGGYWILDGSGRVATFGDATRFGDEVASHTDPVALTARPRGDGYWVVDRHGAVRPSGEAAFHGSIEGLRDGGADIPPIEVVDVVAAPSGRGYWVLDASGGVFSFGDAAFRGSAPALREAGYDVPPVAFTSMTATPSGDGYWLLDAAGGLLSFGDATFHGSAAPTPIAEPAVEVMGGDGGSWVLYRDGRVVDVGDVRYHGSLR